MASPLSVEVPIKLKSLDLPINLQLNVTANLAVEMETDRSNFEDVGDFHRKFDLHASDDQPGLTEVTRDLLEFRIGFMQEELNEFIDAATEVNHVDMFDALIDLVYVAMGTAHLFGYPWQKGWDEVQRANMTKLRATTAEQSMRGGTWDVVKGPDWTPPNIAGILEEVGFE